MKTENADKPAAIQAINTITGFLTVLIGGSAWVAGIAVAHYTYGAWAAVLSAVFFPYAWILYAAALLGLLP